MSHAAAVCICPCCLLCWPAYLLPEVRRIKCGSCGERLALPFPLPFTHYFRCIDDANPPAGYVGDWPDEGTVYAGHVKPSVHTGEAHIYLDGFWAAAPFGAFAAARFEFFVMLSLN